MVNQANVMNVEIDEFNKAYKEYKRNHCSESAFDLTFIKVKDTTISDHIKDRLKRIQQALNKSQQVNKKTGLYDNAIRVCIDQKKFKFVDFCSDKKNTIKKTFVVANTGAILSGGTAGAVIGGIIGGPFGAALGVGVGVFLFGGLVGTAAGTVITANSFYKWKREICTEEFMQMFINFHKDHDELKKYICEFNHQLITDPLISPFGHTYDKVWIIDWIKSKETELKDKTDPDWTVTDPHRNGRLKVDDLKRDYNRIADMHETYSKILEDDARIKNLPKQIVEGLKAIKEDLNIQIKDSLLKARNNNFNKFISEKISEEEFLNLEKENIAIEIAFFKFAHV